MEGEGVKKRAMEAPESDGEEEYSGCCLFRSGNRRLTKGASYARLESDDPSEEKPKLQRSRTVCAEVFCCCGPRAGARSNYTTVEVRSVSKKWEVGVNEEESVKPSYWRALVHKLTSHGHVRRPSRGSDWLSYDARAYQMNFDDGCGRENCVSYLFKDPGTDGSPEARGRTMQAALVKKFAAVQEIASSPGGSPMSPVLSPLPVKMLSKEELEKSKQGAVPIWQRRQGAPPIKLDLRQRAGPMD